MSGFGSVQSMKTALENNKKMRSRHQNIYDHKHDLKTNLKIKDKGKKLSDSEREAIREKIKNQQRIQLIRAIAVVGIIALVLGYLIYLKI
ncbi:hypothetical protein [Saccharicrinis sp. FJH54]|uniref:hypothetical protein n=1 Tax=Saccharicrinis sp. FJH54 TaxID=3344665 RepID=UPI0035D4B90F